MVGDSIPAPTLQEIASLLLVLHDQYLTFDDDAQANGSQRHQVFRALIQFVIDIELSDAICLLDIERLRIYSMQISTTEEMGYETFYDWLRQISLHTFSKRIVEKQPTNPGKQELHHLLTEYIIPFSKRLEDLDNEEQSKSFSSKVKIGNIAYRRLNLLTDNALLVMSHYSEFIQWLYLDILINVSQGVGKRENISFLFTNNLRYLLVNRSLVLANVKQIRAAGLETAKDEHFGDRLAISTTGDVLWPVLWSISSILASSQT
jgi:hypothetical protein